MDKISILKFKNGEYEIKDNELTNNFNQFKSDISEEVLNVDNKLMSLKENFIIIDDYKKEPNDISDSERLQRAVNYLNDKGGGTIYLGYNNLNIHENILIKPNITLIGEGVNATKITIVDDTSFIKNGTSNRYDYITLKDMAIRINYATEKPLIDLTNISHSKFDNLYLACFIETGNTIGIKFDNKSYYNTISHVQTMGFNTGLYFINQANGNSVIGGSAILCRENGVLIDNCDSNRFVSHSVELKAINGYKLINGSYYNNFIACRIEHTSYSYVIPFVADNPSFSNVFFGGLDYSTNKTNISGANAIYNHNTLYDLRDLKHRNSALAALMPAVELPTPSASFTKLALNRKVYDRNNRYNETLQQFTAREAGIYNIKTRLRFNTTLTNVDFKVIINSSSITYPIAINGTAGYFDLNLYLEKNAVVSFEIKPNTNCNLIGGHRDTYLSFIMM